MNQTSGIYQFTHPGGEDIYLFHLINKQGTEVRVTNLGAITTAFILQTTKGPVNIVLGFDQVADYISPEYLAAYPYFGAAIGRYANRIANGHFFIDGKTFEVTRNQPPHHLHGGNNGFDKKVWQVKNYDPENAQLTLTYTSPDGEEGFPGQLDTELRIHLTNDSELIYTFHATADQPTAVNLTHHDYFDLDPSSNGIGEQLVQINASHWLAQDASFVVTGELIPVEATTFDFREPKPIGQDADPVKGYDQSFVIDPTEGAAATAFSPRTGLTLEVFTTAPVIHFYTGRYIPLLSGKFGPFSGYCFETQVHPNAINIHSFPNTVLRPGEKYEQRTVYRVSGEVLK
ncbi:galactose mutarotase [Nostoc ellipsosporum NOK]|nr:galactose mutarotase [Nostoc ellipsosporum NOK]